MNNLVHGALIVTFLLASSLALYGFCWILVALFGVKFFILLCFAAMLTAIGATGFIAERKK